MKPSESQRWAPLFSGPDQRCHECQQQGSGAYQARGLEHLDGAQQGATCQHEDGDRQEQGVLEQEMEAGGAVELGDGRAGRRDQDEAEDNQSGSGADRHPVHRPDPLGGPASVGAGQKAHPTPPISPRTPSRKASPRASKLSHWSKEAAAGASSTTSPGCASR